MQFKFLSNYFFFKYVICISNGRRVSLLECIERILSVILFYGDISSILLHYIISNWKPSHELLDGNNTRYNNRKKRDETNRKDHLFKSNKTIRGLRTALYIYVVRTKDFNALKATSCYSQIQGATIVKSYMRRRTVLERQRRVCLAATVLRLSVQYRLCIGARLKNLAGGQEEDES